MQRITYVNTSVLVADQFGDLVLEYAGALARNRVSERLQFRGIGADGDEEIISFIVGPASQIVVESVNAGVDYAPDNPEAMALMQRRIRELSDPRPTAEQEGHGTSGNHLGID